MDILVFEQQEGAGLAGEVVQSVHSVHDRGVLGVSFMELEKLNFGVFKLFRQHSSPIGDVRLWLQFLPRRYSTPVGGEGEQGGWSTGCSGYWFFENFEKFLDKQNSGRQAEKRLAWPLVAGAFAGVYRRTFWRCVWPSLRCCLQYSSEGFEGEFFAKNNQNKFVHFFRLVYGPQMQWRRKRTNELGIYIYFI